MSRASSGLGLLPVILHLTQSATLGATQVCFKITLAYGPGCYETCRFGNERSHAKYFDYPQPFEPTELEAEYASKEL